MPKGKGKGREQKTEKYGRGVLEIIDIRDIREDELLEVCPVIVSPKAEEEYLN
jgi:hypothetical protein